VVYTSDSPSLAVLESLGHADASQIVAEYVSIQLDLPHGIPTKILTVADLPSDWRDSPAPSALRKLGDAWALARTEAVLVVPSAILPAQNNFLLNPEHAAIKRLRPHAPEPFKFDPRLKR